MDKKTRKAGSAGTQRRGLRGVLEDHVEDEEVAAARQLLPMLT
jgi:hypothetical protein